MTNNASPANQHAIRLAEKVEIPLLSFASQGNAILGIRDSGKSYSATYLAEQLIRSGIPIIAFDPIGVWHNLRCAGTGPGMPVVVAGGQHGDFQISRDNAETVVRVALQSGRSLVIDLYDMRLSKADWRSIVETCVRLMLYENKAHQLRHVFVEEAAEFVPQMVTREYGGVYSELEKLARMGGNAMLGYTLINQRAEQVNKAVLELCDCLFLHRQKGRLSLTALDKWLAFGNQARGSKIIESLPMLEQGECWVWQGGTDMPELVKMPTKQTFHPNRREQQEAGERLALPFVGETFWEAIGKPKKEKESKKAEPVQPPQIERVPVFAPGEIARLELLVREIWAHLKSLESSLAAAEALSSKLSTELFTESRARKEHLPAEQNGSEASKYDLSSGQRQLLITANTYYPRRLTPTQLGTLAGYTPSTVRTYLPQLRQIGYLAETNEGLLISPAARAIVQHETPPRPADKRGLVEAWMQRLNGGEASLLKVIWEAGKRGIQTAGHLASLAGYTPSTVRTYLPVLRNNRLIEKDAIRCVAELLD